MTTTENAARVELELLNQRKAALEQQLISGGFGGQQQPQQPQQQQQQQFAAPSQEGLGGNTMQFDPTPGPQQQVQRSNANFDQSAPPSMSLDQMMTMQQQGQGNSTTGEPDGEGDVSMGDAVQSSGGQKRGRSEDEVAPGQSVDGAAEKRLQSKVAEEDPIASKTTVLRNKVADHVKMLRDLAAAGKISEADALSATEGLRETMEALDKEHRENAQYRRKEERAAAKRFQRLLQSLEKMRDAKDGESLRDHLGHFSEALAANSDKNPDIAMMSAALKPVMDHMLAQQQQQQQQFYNQFTSQAQGTRPVSLPGSGGAYAAELAQVTQAAQAARMAGQQQAAPASSSSSSSSSGAQTPSDRLKAMDMISELLRRPTAPVDSLEDAAEQSRWHAEMEQRRRQGLLVQSSMAAARSHQSAPLQEQHLNEHEARVQRMRNLMMNSTLTHNLNSVDQDTGCVLPPVVGGANSARRTTPGGIWLPE